MSASQKSPKNISTDFHRLKTPGRRDADFEANIYATLAAPQSEGRPCHPIPKWPSEIL